MLSCNIRSKVTLLNPVTLLLIVENFIHSLYHWWSEATNRHSWQKMLLVWSVRLCNNSVSITSLYHNFPCATSWTWARTREASINSLLNISIHVVMLITIDPWVIIIIIKICVMQYHRPIAHTVLLFYSRQIFIKICLWNQQPTQTCYANHQDLVIVLVCWQGMIDDWLIDCLQ